MGGLFLHTPHVCGHQGRGHSCYNLWREQPGPAADLHLLTPILQNGFAKAAPHLCS